MIKDSRIQFPPRWCHGVDGEVHEPPLIHTVNYPDITSPLMERVQEGKGQQSDWHKDQITMHVTAQPALPTSHSGENATVVSF